MTAEYYYLSRVFDAVSRIEECRESAARRQSEAGHEDAGLRGRVTSGSHLDSLADVIADVLVDAGLNRDEIFLRSKVDLPGYYRPEKKWDLLAFHKDELVVAVELKSIWSSFGNNMNNRAEEAIGSGYDFRLAVERKLMGDSTPWLGYVFVMRDDPQIRSPKTYRQSHFSVDPLFQSADYLERSMLTCRRLVRERVYDRVFFALWDGVASEMKEPASDMTWAKFEAALRGRVAEALA